MPQSKNAGAEAIRARPLALLAAEHKAESAVNTAAANRIRIALIFIRYPLSLIVIICYFLVFILCMI
jgi:hypothetical protein